MPDTAVQLDPEGHRFVAHLAEGDAVLAYRAADERTLDLVHTEVPTAARGRGIADDLVRAAIAHARAEGLRLVASCPFVRGWLARHPSEGDVFVDGTR